MAVMAASGLFGSGKTAFSVYLARSLAARRRCPLWANFSLVGSQPIYTFDDLYRCEGGVIVLDELQGTIHARRSNHNLVFLKWFDQCRKQDSDVICITQALHKIDLIVREMIEIAFECEKRDTRYSRITPIDMYSGRSRAAFRFDRSVSYPYYDHRERAWALVENVKDSEGVKKPKSAATVALATARRPVAVRGSPSRGERGWG